MFGQYGGAITQLLLLWLIDEDDRAERERAFENIADTFIARDSMLYVMNHVAEHARSKEAVPASQHAPRTLVAGLILMCG